MKTEIYTNGVLVSCEDNATLEEAKEYRKSILKMDCQREILERVPTYKQINIGKNLMPADEEAELLAQMKACIDAYEAAKAQVLAATTNDDVYAINYLIPNN